MISLNAARSLVEEVIDRDLPVIYMDLTLQEWTRKGVISRIKVESGAALYPDIVAAEIITALSLRGKYSLEEIAAARRCLELEGSQPYQINEEEIIRFINCSKLLVDKKLVTKLSLKNIESLEKIKELIDDLVKEKQHLEVVGDYLSEFLRADRELRTVKKNKDYVS